MRRKLLAALGAIALALVGAAAQAETLTIQQTPAVPRSYLAGCVLSNDGSTPNTTIDVAACQAADSGNAALISLGAFTKKTSGAWAAGTGGNGMGQGLTVANATWYDVCLAANGNAPDIFFDTAVSGQTPCAQHRPSAITDTRVRRLGSIKTDGSANILTFAQDGDVFYWQAANQDANALVTSSSAALLTVSVPTGVKVRPLLRMLAVTTPVLMSSPDGPDLATNATFATTPGYNVGTTGSPAPIGHLFSNTSGQVRLRSSGAGTLTVYTDGWIDERGRIN